MARGLITGNRNGKEPLHLNSIESNNGVSITEQYTACICRLFLCAEFSCLLRTPGVQYPSSSRIVLKFIFENFDILSQLTPSRLANISGVLFLSFRLP